MTVLGRRLAREKALQALFQIDVGKISPEKALHYSILEGDLSNSVKEFAKTLVMGTVEHLEEVDKLISQHTKDWQLNRMANVDRNILRLAVFEFLYEPDIPYNVTINEAIELAKVFSSDEAGAFVNGILDQIKLFIESNSTFVEAKRESSSGN